ncbi:GAF domain-containing sensor histidine kinase [Leptolyngbya sp. FACHB-671]|uniref:GAF domain-containing sensor histidine kinase n=1 Tax=Leptolyngbya sp. FACHB-671 TaxID=2692812 RepID=UPI001689FA68|nr:GAF domain-containing sensor histidine kinase [Leptolyngbya sp. FACHB-671]MBD2070122.1 GAF domain-containing sensor histidine kinase [Leptolyngbya sp. FACHB-671]
MLTSLPESLPEICSQFLSSLSSTDVDLKAQMQGCVVQLQQALEIEQTLSRISETVRASLDETFSLNAVVQELALELEADCYIVLRTDTDQQRLISSSSSQAPTSSFQTKVLSLDHDPEINHCLRATDYLQFCFNTNLPEEKFTLFACSVNHNDENLGNLWVIQATSKTLTELEIHLLQKVAKQCAIAIQQSRLYQAAQSQVEELKQLNEVKDNFLNQAIHDLRSPLANMQLAIHMLEHQLAAGRSDSGDTSQQNPAYIKTLTHLKILQTECERELTLVNNLLELQRLESGLASEKQSLDLVDAIDLRDWLIDLIRPFEDRIQQRQITLELQIAPCLPTIVSDSDTLHRVLSELLHNACKYTPPHETISIHARSSSECVQIEIRNSGVEIPVEEQLRIFDKFYRIPNSDRWKQGGTGLGLTLVKEMLVHLRGSIYIESGSGQTCFTIQLPLR